MMSMETDLRGKTNLRKNLGKLRVKISTFAPMADIHIIIPERGFQDIQFIIAERLAILISHP